MGPVFTAVVKIWTLNDPLPFSPLLPVAAQHGSSTIASLEGVNEAITPPLSPLPFRCAPRIFDPGCGGGRRRSACAFQADIASVLWRVGGM